MPTTTKMGIVYPSSTDLVKDGATAMGTISTTVDNKTGLIYISTTSFTGVSSVSLPNDTFTATFDNYYLMIQFDDFTADASAFIRLRKAGADATGNNYYFASRGLTAAGTSFDTTMNPTTDGIFIQDTDAVGYTPTWSFIKLFAPKLSCQTGYVTEFAAATQAGVVNFQTGGGTHNVVDTYDAATIRVTAGNMTGKVLVFAWNK